MMQQQQQNAASGLHTGKVVAFALEHMMKGEEALAKKQSRGPRLITESMADEVGFQLGLQRIKLIGPRSLLTS